MVIKSFIYVGSAIIQQRIKDKASHLYIQEKRSIPGCLNPFPLFTFLNREIQALHSKRPTIMQCPYSHNILTFYVIEKHWKVDIAIMKVV